MHRTRPRVALILAAALSAALVPAAAADAAVAGYSTTTRWIGGGAAVNVRSAPSVTSTVVRSLPTGTPIVIDCQLAGGRLGFSSWADNRTWDRLTDGTYIHDAVTTTPSGPHTSLPDGGYVAWSSTVPRCPVVPAAAAPSGTAAAVQWAQNQVGRATAAPADAGLYTPRQWSPGPIGEWSGDCFKFVDVAWRYGGRGALPSLPTADALWRSYGSPQNGANAPLGALVFWRDDSRGANVVGSAGHVALSDGIGGVYTTRGGDGAGRTVAHVTYAQLGYGQPTGWALR